MQNHWHRTLLVVPLIQVTSEALLHPDSGNGLLLPLTALNSMVLCVFDKKITHFSLFCIWSKHEICSKLKFPRVGLYLKGFVKLTLNCQSEY